MNQYGQPFQQQFNAGGNPYQPNQNISGPNINANNIPQYPPYGPNTGQPMINQHGIYPPQGEYHHPKKDNVHNQKYKGDNHKINYSNDHNNQPNQYEKNKNNLNIQKELKKNPKSGAPQYLNVDQAHNNPPHMHMDMSQGNPSYIQEALQKPAIQYPEAPFPYSDKHNEPKNQNITEMPPLNVGQGNKHFHNPINDSAHLKQIQPEAHAKIKKANTKAVTEDEYKISAEQAKNYLVAPQTSNLKGSVMFSKGNFINVNHGEVKELYNFKKLLGKGSFGEVWEAENKLNKNKVAIKIISKKILHKDAGLKKQMKLEFDLLKKLDHPNVMRIFDAFENHSDIYIVSEFMEGGELAKRAGNRLLRENEVCKIMSQILKGLAYCHSLGVAHRDLKPENAMYENKDADAALKLIDFGLSAIVNQKQKCQDVLGSPLYMAPEVVSRQPYNEKCDIWSCGIMMYTFLCCQVPYKSTSMESLFEEIKNINFNYNSFSGKYWNNVSKRAIEFLLKMLRTDPKSRASALELVNDKYLTSECPAENLNPETEQYMIANMINFSRESSFQRMIRNFIASSLTTSKEVKAVRKEFMQIDKNKDGKISKKEWLDASELIAANLRIPVEEMESVFDKINTDKNGFIDYTEFLAASLNNSLTSERKNLEMAFNYIDKDHSGFITSEELKRLFKGDYGKNKSYIDKIINSMSCKNDGKIYKEEFIKEMQKIVYYHQGISI